MPPAAQRVDPERLDSHRVRTLLLLAAVPPLVCWGVWQGTKLVPRGELSDRAVSGISRYQPMRELLQDTTRADLLVVSDRPQDAAHAFWHAQYALAPTVLITLRDRQQALHRARRADPQVLVVILRDHREFLRFARQYRRQADRRGGAVRIHDFGDGLGLLMRDRERRGWMPPR